MSSDLIQDLIEILPICPPEAQIIIERSIQALKASKNSKVHIAKDAFETYNQVQKMVLQLRPGREGRAFAQQAKKTIREAESVEDQILLAHAKIKHGCKLLLGLSELSDYRYREAAPNAYTLYSRTQNRARALAGYITETGRTMIKSDEARADLAGIEEKPLYRMQVLRALKLVPGILAGAVFEVIATGKPARVRLEGNNCASTTPDRNQLLRHPGGTGAPLG